MNPSKQRFLEKKNQYEVGRIQTPELLSSDDLCTWETLFYVTAWTCCSFSSCHIWSSYWSYRVIDEVHFHIVLSQFTSSCLLIWNLTVFHSILFVIYLISSRTNVVPGFYLCLVQYLISCLIIYFIISSYFTSFTFSSFFVPSHFTLIL